MPKRKQSSFQRAFEALEKFEAKVPKQALRCVNVSSGTTLSAVFASEERQGARRRSSKLRRDLMPCPRSGRLRTMTPLRCPATVITAVALAAMLHLSSIQPALGQAYTLPGLSDLPALPGLASGLINSVTSGTVLASGRASSTSVAVAMLLLHALMPFQMLSWSSFESILALWFTCGVAYYSDKTHRANIKDLPVCAVSALYQDKT